MGRTTEYLRKVCAGSHETEKGVLEDRMKDRPMLCMRYHPQQLVWRRRRIGFDLATTLTIPLRSLTQASYDVDSVWLGMWEVNAQQSVNTTHLASYDVNVFVLTCGML